MGVDASHPQVGTGGANCSHRYPVVPGDPKTVHPSVQLQMDREGGSGPIQRLGMLQTDHRLGQAEAGQERDGIRSSPA